MNKFANTLNCFIVQILGLKPYTIRKNVEKKQNIKKIHCKQLPSATIEQTKKKQQKTARVLGGNQFFFFLMCAW